jgi:hypothetical protein
LVFAVTGQEEWYSKWTNPRPVPAQKLPRQAPEASAADANGDAKPPPALGPEGQKINAVQGHEDDHEEENGPV